MSFSKKLISSLARNIQKSWIFFIDLIFPIECLGCGKEGEWLCPECFRKMSFKEEQYCFGCKTETNFGEFCRFCKPNYSLRGIMIAGEYDNELVRKLIRSFKYFLVKDIGKELGKFLSLFLAGIINENGFADRKRNFVTDINKAIILPVPLHPKRERWRGFNQSEIIAGIILENFNMEMTSGELVRIKEKKIQANLKERERKENILGCFQWRGERLDGRNVILVDDIATTGATLNECAKILKENGAGEIWGLVVAKG